MAAVEAGAHDLIRTLLARGADPNLPNASHQTPLWVAASRGDLSSVRLPLEHGADPELLRARGIPAGICYQRLTRGATAATGHCVHALNTIFLASQGRWVRVDARGNKPGVDAQFSLSEERLAFPIRDAEGEVDYLVNYPEPHPLILAVLEAHEDCRLMYGTGRLPSDLQADLSTSDAGQPG